MPTQQQPPRAPGRPRDPELEGRILRATQDLLAERGYAGTTIGDVARAARSGKTAIYRRWESKLDLIVAAVRELYAAKEIPDTGSFRGDVLACAMHYAGSDERSGLILSSILMEVGNDPELEGAARTAIGEPPVTAMLTVLTRWSGRGIVSRTAPLHLLARIVPNFAFSSVTARRSSLSAETVGDLVDRVLIPAAMAGSGSHPVPHRRRNGN